MKNKQNKTTTKNKATTKKCRKTQISYQKFFIATVIQYASNGFPKYRQGIPT